MTTRNAAPPCQSPADDAIFRERGRCTFKQRDMTRALRAADAAGREVRRVEIYRDGKIVLVMTEQADAEPKPDQPRPDQIIL